MKRPQTNPRHVLAAFERTERNPRETTRSAIAAIVLSQPLLLSR